MLKKLFSGMGLLAFLIGGLTVVVGERCAKRCAPETVEANPSPPDGMTQGGPD